MKLYKLSQEVNKSFGNYDSIVVASESIDKAVLILPDHVYAAEVLGYWAKPSDVAVTYLGKATNSLEEGQVICESFNAY